MSDYTKQLQRIVREYQRSGEAWPASASDIALWALKNHKYDLATPTIQRICSRELAQAMREEYITDPKGRRVRAKHPAKVNRDGKQIMLWDDIRTAPRTHMEMAFMTRRNHIVGECRQVKTDVDSYNDSHSNEKPIQMILDFTSDVEELEELEKFNRTGKGVEFDEMDEVEDLDIEELEAIA
jgi:hypothetical protein